MKLNYLPAFAAVLLLGACATVSPVRSDRRIVELVDLLNTGTAAEAADLSGTPFLFGEEVLSAAGDVEAVIARLKESGVVFAPVVGSSSPISGAPADARFAVSVFFDRLPPDAVAVEVDSSAGPVTLVMGGRQGRLPLLYGIVRGTL